MATTKEEYERLNAELEKRFRSISAVRPNVDRLARAVLWREASEKAGIPPTIPPPENGVPPMRHKFRRMKWEFSMRGRASFGTSGPHDKDIAAEILRTLTAGSRIANLASIDDMETMAASLVLPWTRKDKRPKAAGRRREVVDELMWDTCSLEHAIVWLVCRKDPTIAAMAGEIAAGRSDVGGTVRRALMLYRTFLRMNLIARGTDPERVIRFRRTRSRPLNPIMPEGMSADDVKATEWIERTPRKRTAEKPSDSRIEVVDRGSIDVLAAPPIG